MPQQRTPQAAKKEPSWKQIFFGKNFRRSAFYFLIISLATMTVIDVSQLVREYIEDPKKANMDIVFNETITFPTMTFCMSKEQAWSHFKVDMGNKTANFEEWDDFIEENLKNITDKNAFLKSPWDYRLVVRSYEAIGILNSLERETDSKSTRDEIVAFAKARKYKKVRHLVKVFRSLRGFSKLSYNEDADEVPAKVKITWISLAHLCFQPTLLNDTFEDITDQGQIFRIVLLHNVTNVNNTKKTSTEDECMSLDMHGRPTTMARNMEGKGRVKDGVTEELCMGLIHEVSVDIRASYIMLPNNDKPTACRNYDEGDESEFDCRSRCRMEMIRHACGCTALTLHYLADSDDLDRFPICDYEKCNMKNFTDQLCASRCLPDCVQTRFNVEVSQKGRSVRPGKLYMVLEAFVDLTRVTIYWGSFEYLKLEQEYVWTVATFIAALGGSIGMWLGLSMLSLIQFLMYIASKVSRKVKEKRSIVPAATQQPTHQAVNTIEISSQPNSRKGSRDRKNSGDRKYSSNPFGDPSTLASNPFNSPFGEKEKEGKLPESKSFPY